MESGRREGKPNDEGDPPTGGHIPVLQAARREREKGQVLGTPNVVLVIDVVLHGQPAFGFALVQQPQGQDERNRKVPGTFRKGTLQ